MDPEFTKGNTLLPIPIDVLRKYAGKRIAIKAYDSNPESDFYIGDFLMSGMTSVVCGDVESDDTDFTSTAKDFFNEPCWDILVKKLIESDGEVFTPNGEYVNDSSVLLHELRDINPLYKSGDVIEAPFPILFSEMPSQNVLGEIEDYYGTELDSYLQTCQLLANNRAHLRTLDVMFERNGFTVLRNQHYRFILKNYWFHILLNKRGFSNEFKPYISLAPKIHEGSYESAYHELHEQTQVYQLMEVVKIGELNTPINLALLEEFTRTLADCLHKLDVTMKSESEQVEYLNRTFTMLDVQQRSQYLSWDTKF